MKRSCSTDEAGGNALIKKQATQDMTTIEVVQISDDPISDVEEENTNDRYDCTGVILKFIKQSLILIFPLVMA